MSLYKNILSQAWQITWRNKYLWFFGLFAALLGNGGEYEIIVRGLSGETGQSLFPGLRRVAETGIFSKQALVNIKQLIEQDLFSIIMIAVVGLVIFILFCFLVWLAVVSQAALVNNSAKIITKKKAQELGVQDGIISGIKNFWPVLGLNIVIKLIIYSLFALLSLPFILTTVKTGVTTASFTYLIAFIIFVPVAIALSFMIKYAIAYVVIQGSNFFKSIKEGWQLFVKNWLISIEMAFFLFFINLLVGFAAILIILVLMVPFLFLALVFYYLVGFTGFWAMAVLALIVFLIIIILTGAALATFQISAWTGLFLELINKGGSSKIERVISAVKEKIDKRN